MTETEQKQIAEQIVTIATNAAAEVGLPADRIAASFVEAGCQIIIRETSVRGCAAVLQEMANHLILNASDCAGNA